LESDLSERVGLADLLVKDEAVILATWISEQLSAETNQCGLSESDIKDSSRAFLSVFTTAVISNYSEQIVGAEWDDVRAYLAKLSRERVVQGFSLKDTAKFVFALKKPLIDRLSKSAEDADHLSEEFWKLTQVLDKLGLVSVSEHQKIRQQIIERQQQELLDLTTPVVKLWDSIVALPLIGTLDSERTQVVMESLLDSIVENEAAIAIIDITGVPTVDTLVAQHLLKTVAAARLMGAECIISGIRPQIAQTIVHLGVDLGDVVTKATLAEALKIALSRVGLTVGKLGSVKAGD
jgi:rsbT co-antagonist protein RsbR